MLTISYVYVGLSVFLLVLIIRIIQKEKRNEIRRYHGIIKKNKDN